MRTWKQDLLTVKAFATRAEMGRAAAKDIKEKICEILLKKEEINMIFAAAPSQNDVLRALVDDPDIPWERIHGYHMDEYIGLPDGASQGFGNFLKRYLFDLVPFASVQYIDSTASDPVGEACRYSEILRQNPVDIVVLGIGENGHIAFNDPGVADFRDPETVKVVPLDAICRQQQVNDGCFASLSAVPTHALTLTIPTLIAAPWMFCIVPATTKAKAVRETLCGTVDEHCPASILRTKEGAVLYLDKDSAALLS